MNPALTNKQSCRVLVFSPLKRLIAIFQSINSAANAFNTTAVNVYFACNGKSISCCNLYFRHLHDNIEVTQDDLGTLRLEEYDELCGITRKYYPTKEMSRNGMKYKTNSKSK